MRSPIHPEADNLDDDIPLEENYFLDSPEALAQAPSEKDLKGQKINMSILIARKGPQKVLDKDVLIIGAGIAGMQAALDLADKGYRVVLLDKTATIGGAMVKLDKTFPTNDCSICTAAPKMVEISRHPNITLLTYSELVRLDGKMGNFTAHVWRRSKYIDPAKCTGCGDCVAACPVIVPNPFDEKLSTRKGIYIEFPQAVPIVYTIDMAGCVGCGSCDRVCEPGAITFLQKSEDIEVRVGSIIVATGFEVFEPDTMRREYGYGKYKNVITAMQFERTLSSFGPTSGKVKRPSDGAVPKGVAWIQCVGSRSLQKGWPYCSRVCCMYATKEASIAKDANPDMNLSIFYMDVRAYGKDFQQYYEHAKTSGIEYIRGRPSSVRENPDKSIIIKYKDTLTGEIKEKTVDLLVLSTAIIPNRDNKALARILGVDVDENGFFKQKDILTAPIQSTKDGIFLSGCSQGPKDIPDSVAMASGAAAKAVWPIKDRARQLTKSLPPERDIKGKEPRIGVFVCHCGKNIANYLDVDAVTEYAKKLPNVIVASHDLFICSEDVGKKMREIIAKEDLNRIVVAACSPRTHGPLFMDTLVEGGLNKYLFEFANIRNQCSWVHSNDKTHATETAKDLVRMAVAKVRLVWPLYEQEVQVTPRSLVLGGGVAGMRAALALAKMGIETVLIEKDKELGGRLKELYTLFPSDQKASDVLEAMRNEVLSYKNILVRTGTVLKDIQGFIGNFVGTLVHDGKEETVEFGSAIIATGFREIDLTGKYGYRQFKRVVTQTDLERRFKDGTIKGLGEPRSVVMINCAGAMTKERPYCCRIGCGVAIKNAKVLKQFFPDTKVYILYRDMRVFGKEEEEYYSNVVKDQRVLTFRYPGDNAPEVVEEKGVLKVRFRDDVMREDMEIEADLVVLTAETEGDITTDAIKKMFKVPTAVGDFFVEAHAKIRPLDFATDGVYVAGSAHFPKSLADAIAQAEGAASRAAIPILRGKLTLEGTISSPVDEKCDGCAFCIETCPFKAISLIEYMKNGEVKKTIQVNEALCKGCGCCMATCPKEGVDVRGYTLQQLKAQAKEAIETSGEMEPDTEYEPRLVAFCCNWCSYAGADLAGVTRIQYPHNVRIVRVMCSGMVHPNMVMDSLMNGADGVLICGCHIGDCHYLTGNERTKTRAESLALMLQDFGLEPERFRLEWVSASEGIRFAEVMRSMVDDLKKLGPSPYCKRT